MNFKENSYFIEGQSITYCGSTTQVFLFETMTSAVTGIVLSGGQGRRTGGADKGLLPWGESTRIEALLDVFTPQVDSLIISCNRNLDRYRAMAPVIVEDTLPKYQGPLAGVSAALAVTTTEISVCVPCDCPDPPQDLVERLVLTMDTQHLDLSFAHDGTRSQYLFCAIHKRTLDSLYEYLAKGGRAVNRWHQQLKYRSVDFSDCPGKFANHNRCQSASKADIKNPS